jgi:hypothetical protein
MNDIKGLLDRAAGDVRTPPGAAEDDLLRGRRALRRHRARELAMPLGLATVFGTVVAVGARPDATPQQQHAVVQSPLPTTVRPSSAPGSAPSVRLVAYTGEQPSGYRVAYVPDGWEIQGADPFAMTIAPIGFADQHPASFVGKLVVMLRSADDTGTPAGTPRRVGKGTGYLNRTEGIVVLTYQDSAQHWIQLQVPPSLHWSDDDVAAFGAGVEITRDAAPGRG